MKLKVLFCFVLLCACAVGQSNPGGGSPLVGGTTNGTVYATSPTAIATVTPPATNCIWNVIYNVTASATVAPSTGCPGVTVNTPATPYTLLYSDRATYQRLTGGSTFAFTLCQITGTCASNLPFVTANFNSGLLTFTANAADKVNNSATGGTLTVLSNFAAWMFQDSSSAPGNWWPIRVPMFEAFGNTCANALTWSTSTGFGCSGTLGGSLTVNGSGAATNLSSTTPAAGSNGINATIQISGANASVEIVGDGNASNCLLGTGVFGACSAASVVATLPLFSVTSLSQASTQFFGSTVSGSAAGADIFSPFSGTISAMYCHGAPASGQTLAYTAYYDDATTTTVTCTITGTATNCSVTGLSVAIVAGHKLAIQDIASATTGSIGGARCDLKITGTS